MRHIYSQEEYQFLIDNVKGITLKELTERFNEKFNLSVSESAVANQKNKLGISSGIVGGQFKKGQIPFNKGKKWSEYMSKEGQKNSRKTIFEKGNIPYSTRPIGSERTDSEGYIYVKVAEPNKWKLKHRHIYESMYGNIPTGYKLIFADGNRQNVDINNLILVSNAEELIMNKRGLYKRNIELTKTGSLIAKLINKTSKVNCEKDNTEVCEYYETEVSRAIKKLRVEGYEDWERTEIGRRNKCRRHRRNRTCLNIENYQ